MLLTKLMEGIEYTGFDGDCEITDIPSDSRKAGERMAFVCIK